MKTLLLLSAFVLIGCQEQKPFEKPFIIFGKTINFYGNDNVCLYQYIDKNGRTFDFQDTNYAYKIGDTIH